MLTEANIGCWLERRNKLEPQFVDSSIQPDLLSTSSLDNNSLQPLLSGS